MPFGGGDAPIAVRVEILEAVFTIVIDIDVFTEKLGPGQAVVAVVIGAAETLAIEMPFLRTDAPVAVVVEGLKASRRPIIEWIFTVGRIEVAIGGSAAAWAAGVHA